MRLFDKKNLIYILFFASAMILLWPFLFEHQIILQKWASDEIYSFNAYFAKHFGDHLPLWFSSYNHGFPVYLGQSSGFLHPVIILLFKLTDYFSAYCYLMFFNFVVSFMATYVLARKLGMSLRAGIISSFAFTFSQISIYAHAITALGSMLTFLPIFLLCVFKINEARDISLSVSIKCMKGIVDFFFKKRKKFWLIFLTSMILAIGWIISYVEGILLIVVMGFFYALFLDINFYIKNKKDVHLLDSFKTSWTIFVVIILSGILASPWLLPVVNFIKETGRGMTINIDWSGFLAITHLSLSLMRVVHLFYPYASIPYSGNIPQIATGVISDFTYVGILPLFFGILPLVNFKKSREFLFFSIFFFFALLTYLPYIPLNWLIHKLPIFSLFEGYWKWIYIMIFCWAMLAGFGFDLVDKVYQTKKFRFILRLFELLFISVLTLAVVANFIFLFFKDKITTFIQKYFANNLLGNIGVERAIGDTDFNYVNDLMGKTIDAVKWNVSFLNPHFLLAMIFVFISLILLSLFRKNKLSLEKFKLFSVILIVLNFVLLWRGYYQQAPVNMILEPSGVVKFLDSARGEQFRVAGFPVFARYRLDWGIDASDVISRFEADVDLLIPQTNANLFYDIDSIIGVENYKPVRHVRMSTYTLGGISADTDTKLGNEGSGYEMPVEERIKNFNSQFSRNLLSMMNVKYIVTTKKLPEPWKLVFESIETGHKIKTYIYENLDVLPRIYFAGDVTMILANTETAFEELKKIKNFKQTTLIECDNVICFSAVPKNISKKDELKIEKIDFDYLKLKTKTKTPRWLVYSQSNLPTWEIKIDGKLTDIYTANYIYQGIYIPAGEHEIEYRYPGFMKQYFYSIIDFIENPNFLLKFLNRER